MIVNKQENAQDLMTKELLEEDTDIQNDTLELMEFIKQNGVPLTSKQAKGILILNQLGMSDISNFVLNMRQHMTPTKKFYDLINKLTLADRIKGNAKLDKILKANANPANAPMQGMEPMRRSEIQ